MSGVISRGKIMKKQPVLIVGVMLCLFGILTIPVAALDSDSQVAIGGNRIDPGLKDELWKIHTAHRLDRYDANVKTAEKIIKALDKYGYDTDEISDIQYDISEKRGELKEALDTKDWEALKSVNQDLINLWRDFRKELRQLFKGI